MSKEKQGIRITFRAPITFREVVREFIAKDMHMNESDFYRDAAREKIKIDAPELYKKLFAEVGNHETIASTKSEGGSHTSNQSQSTTKTTSVEGDIRDV